MLRFMFAASLAITSTFAGMSNADAASARCDGCTLNGYINTAAGLGPGTHYISDLPNKRLRKFKVIGSSAPEPLPVSATELADFQDITDVVDLNGGATKFLNQISPNSYPGNLILANTPSTHTAAFLMMNPTLRTAVGTDLANSAFSQSSLYSPVVVAMASLLIDVADHFGVDLEIQWEITWPDGSRSTFGISKENGAAVATLVPGRQYDANGNLLPDPSYLDFTGDLLGDMYFDYFSELEEYLELAGLAGVPIVRGGGSALKCTWGMVNGKLTLRCSMT